MDTILEHNGSMTQDEHLDILMITTSYPPSLGGVQTHVSELSTNLSDRGHNVHVLWLDSDNHDIKNKSDSIVVSRVPVGNIKTRMPDTYLYHKFIREHVQITDPDIIHAHNFWLSTSLLPLSVLRTNTPIILTNHTSSFLSALRSNSRMSKYKLKIYGIAPDIFLAGSEERRVATQKITCSPVIKIPNGVNVIRFHPDLDVEKIKTTVPFSHPTSFIVLSTSRFHSVKGVMDLVQSIPMTNENVKYILLGDGPQRGEIEEFVELNNLDHRVYLPGMVPNDQIESFYSYADVTVLPSLEEAISISALESMSSETPVIGTNIGGIKELIDDGKNGILIPTNSPDRIAEEISKLQSRPNFKRNIGVNARKKVIQNYSWEKITSDVEDVYLSLL